MATITDSKRLAVKAATSESAKPTEASQVVPPATPSFGLVRGQRLLEIIFPEKDSRPSLRSIERYVRRRLIPSVKLGRQRFYSPEQVRDALLGTQKLNRGAR